MCSESIICNSKYNRMGKTVDRQSLGNVLVDEVIASSVFISCH